MEIKIDKNVPMPPRRGPGMKSKYPWKELEVGDSFFVNGGTKTPTISRLACHHAAVTGHKFSIRTEGEGVRVWRIA